MVIVELVDAHGGLEIITSKIRTTDKRRLLWISGLVTFFLSAVLDNLTTTIVMVSLMRKLLKDRNDRLFFAGIIVIAANAGGAWSPIGDVTTTMLWIGGQITALNIVKMLFIPSLVCLAVPLLFLTFTVRGNVHAPDVQPIDTVGVSMAERRIVFFLGIGALLFVPVFKTLTHQPPFMGILLGLGVLWVVTEVMHSGKEPERRNHHTVSQAIRRIDAPSILFFLGILLAISALEAQGALDHAAHWLDRTIGNMAVTGLLIGLLSAVVDNVPLVAAVQGMYDLSAYPHDTFLWEYIAYCAGTGGSILVIGSAAGVAAMGMEKIDFFWYIKRISLLALMGYLAGAGTYMLMYSMSH
jgi:Na+/H+ antiporter NhaD/arsenite permease-like protein